MFAAQFRWLEALPLLAVVSALIVIAVAALPTDRSGLNPGQERFFDVYQRLKPASSSGVSAFQIVSIDAESAEKIGPWPWPRTILADLAKRARAAGAKAVVIAEPLDRPDPLSPATIGEFWLSGTRDADLARQLALLPNTDEALAAALKSAPSVVAIAPEASEGGIRMQRADTRSISWIAAQSAAGAEFMALPAAKIGKSFNATLAASAEPAVAALEPDADNVLRRITPIWSVGDEARPSLALAAARYALGETQVSVIPDQTAVTAAGAAPAEIKFGARRLPLARDGTLRLYLPRKYLAPEISASKLLDKSSSLGQLGGKVVIIGLDAEHGASVRTALGPMSATQAQAVAATQILAGETLVRPRWAGYAEAIAVMLLGAAAIMWSQRLAFWKAVGVAAIASFVLLLGSILAFTFGDILIDPMPAALSLFLGAFSVAGGRSLGVVLRDDSVRGSFQGSLPEPTMKKLREEGATEILDGDYRPLTVLALELRLTDDDMERLAASPDDATKVIASACLDLRKTVIDTGGAAEQAEGGKMFAYFNAPLENADHMNAACSSALRLIESMDKINAGIESSPRTRGVQLHLAIGISSSDCFVGPLGHGRNNRYSAIGPAVDMAVFLRRQAEFYGPAIICDETVFRKTNHHFAFLELDRIKTNKSDRATSIYALIGNPFIKSSKSYRMLDDAHRQLLNAYRAGDFAAARQMLARAKESPGSKIALFDIYEERIRKMAETGAPSDWDGAHSVVI